MAITVTGEPLPKLRKRNVLRAAFMLVAGVLSMAMGGYLMWEWPAIGDKMAGGMLVIMSLVILDWAGKHWKMRRVVEDSRHA